MFKNRRKLYNFRSWEMFSFVHCNQHSLQWLPHRNVNNSVFASHVVEDILSNEFTIPCTGVWTARRGWARYRDLWVLLRSAFRVSGFPGFRTTLLNVAVWCRKIPEISPRAYIFYRTFLRAYIWSVLIIGGKFAFQIGWAYNWREICVSNFSVCKW